ncbi:MAG: hypothetical protein AAFR51_08335 [Pseudomonadota bacterium]
MTNLIKTIADTTIATPAFAYNEPAQTAPNAVTLTIVEAPFEVDETAEPKPVRLLESRGRRAKRRAGRH